MRYVTTVGINTLSTVFGSIIILKSDLRSLEYVHEWWDIDLHINQ